MILSRYWVGGVLLLFFLLRSLAVFIIPPTMDEMVQFYMTYDIAHFLNFPIYFYGQQYMGPLESYFLAPFLRLFNFGFIGARFCYEIFYIAFLVLYVRIVRRLFDRELTAYLFLFLCILPFPAVFFTTLLGYGEVLTLAILSLMLLLKTYEKLVCLRYSLLLGFVSGMAFWCNSIFMIWLVPIGIALLGASSASGWKKGIPISLFSLGFLVGLFPIWIHGLQTGALISFQSAGKEFARIQEMPRLFYLFISRTKYFLSIFSFEGRGWIHSLIRALSFIPISLFILAFGALIFSFLRSFRGQRPQENIFHIFILFPPFVLAALYSSRNLFRDEGMRYLLPLVISYAFSLAWWIRGFRSYLWKRAILNLLIGIFLVDFLFSLRGQIREASDFKNILYFLEQNNLHSGVANMRLSYPLNALSGDRVLTTPTFPYARYRPLWTEVRRKGAHFFIADRNDSSEDKLRQRLTGDSRIRRISISHYEIFYGPSPLFQKIAESEQPLSLGV